MPHTRLSRSLLSALLGLALLGAGCAPGGGGGASTHLSGQIGRYYANGVSFSVPLVRLAEKPGEPDVFWELRQGIDSTLVMALLPLSGPGDRFRENLALTSQALARPMSAAEYRTEQVQELRQQGNLEGDPVLGEDAAGPWAEYTVRSGQVTIRCLAWFFVRPADSGGSPRGFVLLGTAEASSPELAVYLGQFREVASTFRFGPPPSGFTLLGRAADALVAAAVESAGLPPASAGSAAPTAPSSPPGPGPTALPAESPTPPAVASPPSPPPSPASPSP